MRLWRGYIAADCKCRRVVLYITVNKMKFIWEFPVVNSNDTTSIWEQIELNIFLIFASINL